MKNVHVLFKLFYHNIIICIFKLPRYLFELYEFKIFCVYRKAFEVKTTLKISAHYCFSISHDSWMFSHIIDFLHQLFVSLKLG